MLAAIGRKRHKRLIELRRLSMSKVIPLPHRVDAPLPTLSAEGQRAFLIQLIAGWNEPPKRPLSSAPTARSIRPGPPATIRPTQLLARPRCRICQITK